MKTVIMDRDQIERRSRRAFEPRTAIISITDSGWSYAELENKPAFLLQLAFDDVDGDVFWDELGRAPTDAERKSIERRYHMLSDEQAEAVAGFILSLKDRADLLICQCEHGQSRSAAIAAAVLEYQSRSGIEVFADDCYYPNKTVFKKVLRQLQQKGD